MSVLLIYQNKYSVKYPFIYDDTFLIAELDKSSGKQWLVMQKIDKRTLNVLIESRIQCIHTAITTLQVNDFEDQVYDDDFEQEMLKIRSSEGVREIKLEPEEKFFAFKSWVAGIAEAGINAITIQSDIEQYAHLHYPIANRLFNFLLKAKTTFIQDFVEQMERNCAFEGKYHKPSVNANLLKILDIMILDEKTAWNIWRDQIKTNYEWSDKWNVYLIKNFYDLMEAIFELQPSAQVFLENKRYHVVLTMPESKTLSDWDKATRESVVYNNVFYFCYKDEETGLMSIDLYANKIPNLESIQGLERISHLQRLHLNNNLFEKIEGFESFPNLRHLHLSWNYISLIEGLDHLKDLEVLFLGYNKIEEITGLEQLTKLKELYLYSNKIKTITGIENLKNLEVLNLAWNEIEQIEGLDKLTAIRILNLGGNQITKVEGLENLTSIENLELFNNKLNETPELNYLPKLKDLNLNDNPFNKKT